MIEHKLRSEFSKLVYNTIKNGKDKSSSYGKLVKRIRNKTLIGRSMIDILVKLTKDVKERNEVVDILKKELSLPITSYKYIPYLRIRCDKKDFYSIKKHLSGKTYVEECYIANTKYIPELIPLPVKLHTNILWNLKNIGADIAKHYSDGKTIRVAVIDTGTDYTHKDLKEVYKGGYDFVCDTKNPFDENGHGTHVSGIACGKTTGVATASDLYSLKVLGADGSGSEADIISSIEWCIDHEMDIINMSLGSEESSDAEYLVIREAYNHGILICAAAGNEYYGPLYPASYRGVISVAAVDKENLHADFSNIWETTDISAPGVDIWSCVPGGYDTYSGTSMASPHVTGSLALLKSILFKNNNELERILADCAQKLGNINDVANHAKYGDGLVRADIMCEYASRVLRKSYSDNYSITKLL